jgi:hypothetical protein
MAISKGVGVLALVSFSALWGSEVYFQFNRPHQPDVSAGRIYPHVVKTAVVYLTRLEDAVVNVLPISTFSLMFLTVFLFECWCGPSKPRPDYDAIRKTYEKRND